MPYQTLHAPDKIWSHTEMQKCRYVETQNANHFMLMSVWFYIWNAHLPPHSGSHVIEHERQKMSELKKKSHDEARAQYLQLQNNCDDR